jgi:pimeloyl-ACP methyl ester carboxylesterase
MSRKLAATGIGLIVLACVLAGLALNASTKGGVEMSMEIERKVCRAADGVEIVYSVCGTGEPALVFIHGGFADRGFWDGQLQAFGGRHRTIALDLAGHGESGVNRTKWGMPEFGADVRAVVEAERVKRVILIGNSLGGPVAIEAALLLPEKAVGVIGIDTFQDLGGVITPEQAKARADAFGADFGGAVKQMTRALFHADADPKTIAWAEARMARTSPQIARPMFLSLAGYDTGASARRLKVPIRAVNGDLYPTDIEAIRKVKPDFDAIVMTHMGHYPMIERPEEFNRALAGVIAGLEK